MVVAAIATKNSEPMIGFGAALMSAFGFWIASVCLDYLARSAFHSERAANSLERMEWAATAPHREAEQRAKEAAIRSATARQQAETAAAREAWEAAQRAAQGE